MICYKDTTFCASDCEKKDCGRYFGEYHKKNSEKWWGGPGAPVAFADFSEQCGYYLKGDVA